MRIALLSDIHGNLLGLDAVLADVAGQGRFDEVIVAGDLVWSGPWPAEVVDLIRAAGAIAIQGNTDAYFALPPGEVPEGKNEERYRAQMDWMISELGPERSGYLARLPFSHRIAPVQAPASDLLVVHANPVDMDRGILQEMDDAELEALIPDDGLVVGAEVLAFGHVHVPYQRHWRGRLLINVASAGLPMDGDPRACWVELNWNGSGWCAEHRRVFFDVRQVAHRMRTCGMPRGKHFAERMLAAAYTGAGQPPARVVFSD